MTTLRIAAGVHAREFDDEIVVVDVRRGVYFSLNGVGSVIWKALAGGASPAAAADAVVAAFDVDVGVARTDTDILVAELRKVGLLEENGVARR